MYYVGRVHLLHIQHYIMLGRGHFYAEKQNSNKALPVLARGLL